jgi:hypothetical protein
MNASSGDHAIDTLSPAEKHGASMLELVCAAKVAPLTVTKYLTDCPLKMRSWTMPASPFSLAHRLWPYKDFHLSVVRQVAVQPRRKHRADGRPHGSPATRNLRDRCRKKVGLSNKVSDKLALRPKIEIVRRPDLLNAALVHYADAV